MSKQQLSQQPLSKAGKKQKNLYLSDQARQLLAIFSHDMGISETAVVELLIREKAARENVAVASSSNRSTPVRPKA